MSTPNDVPKRNSNSRQFGPRDWPASASVEALEDEDSHFTPPRPGRVLGIAPDPVRRMAAFGAGLGPLLAIVGLVLRAAFGRGGGSSGIGATSGIGTLITGLLLFSAVLFIASLLTLLVKMPAKRPDAFDTPDDGAVI